MNNENNSREIVEYPAYRWLMLFAAVLTMFCGFMVTMSVAPLMGVIAKDLGINIGTASFGLMGMNLFSTAIGVMIAGFLVDKVGIPKIMIGGLTLMLVGNSLFPVIGHSYNGVVVIRIIEALGMAPALILLEPTVSYWFPNKEKGTAIGLNCFCVLGPVLTMMFGPSHVLAAKSWQSGMLCFSVVLIVALIVIIAITAGSKRHVPPSMVKAQNSGDIEKVDFVKSVLKNPAFWLGLCVMAFSNWANQAFNDMSPAYLAVNPPVGVGYGAATAGKFSAFTWIGMIAGMFCAGILIDKVFNGKSAPLVMIGFVCNIIFYNGILLAPIHSSPATLTAWLMIAGFANPFTAVGNQCFAVRTFAPNVIGKVAATWTCISNFMGSFGVMAGSLALRSTGNYKMSFALVATASLLGLIAAFVSRERRSMIEAEVRADVSKAGAGF